MAGAICVAPYAGAWIEICSTVARKIWFFVAPYAGAWIEMTATLAVWDVWLGRSLRGSVD